MTLARYLARTLFAHMSGVMGVLAVLFWVFHFLDQMEDVRSGGYTVAAAGIYALSMVPSWFAQYAVMAAFLGAMTGVGRLQQDSEITAMRAAGWSIFRIGLICASTGTAFAAIAFLAGETIAPRLAMAALQHKTELRFGATMSASTAGVWTRDGLRIVGLDRNSARAVTVLTLDQEGQLQAYADARTARRIIPDAVGYEDYNESRITREGVVRNHEASHVERGRSAVALLTLSEEAMQMPSIRELYERIDELRAAGLDHAELVYELHDRLARLLIAPALVSIAVLCVIGPMRSSRRGSRELVGVVIGFALSMCREAAHSMVTVFALSPITMAWVPLIILLVAVALLARVLQPRRLTARATRWLNAT